MKSRLFIRVRTLIAAGLFIGLGSTVSRPVENPAIFNPVDYSTVPPSSYQSDPISNPVAVDLNGNLVITGNVRRGMHFRDTVPYDSTTSFRANLGTSSLNSFLRDSAGSEDLGDSNRYGIQPYYLRSRTVATTRPGYSGVFGQDGTRFDDRRLQGGFTTGTYVPDSMTQTFSARDNSSTEAGLPGTQTKYETPSQPLLIVKSIKELQKLTQEDGSNISVKDQLLMIERYRKQIQELKERMQKPQEESQETGITFKPGHVVSEREQKQSSTENYNSFNNLELNRTTEKARTLMQQTGSDRLIPEMITTEPYTQINAMTSPDSVLSIDGDVVTQDKGDSLHSDIFEQVKKELEDLIKTVGPTDSREAESTSKDSGTNIVLSSEVPGRKESFKFPSESVISGLGDMKGFSSADFYPVYGDKRGLQTDPESFSLSRFNHHFQEGQEHLKNGRYYAAADSFAMASIYKSDEPLCLAGRGHALLAAGEYISSALFLSRAIEADSEYLKKKIDLAATLGGQHILGSRIADIKEWLLRSGSGQLDFLLGYIYYRMGRLGPAQQAIDMAYSKLPQSTAVIAVKKAVDDAIAGK